MDDWSVFVVDRFDFAQPSISSSQSKLSSLNKSSSLSEVEGTVIEADKSPPRGTMIIPIIVPATRHFHKKQGKRIVFVYPVQVIREEC